MRPLTLKYGGECRKCGATLDVGAQAVYERRAGVWCVPCAPTDTEAIREVRQEAADRKADKIEEWAEARARNARAYQHRSDTLMCRDATGRADWALVTQPGHIPQRAQANRAQERAWEEQSAASKHLARANALRSGVRVAGDKDRAREAIREAKRPLLAIGVRCESPLWGWGEIVRINRKTVRLKLDSARGGGRGEQNEDIRWLMGLPAAKQEAGAP